MEIPTYKPRIAKGSVWVPTAHGVRQMTMGAIRPVLQ